MAEAYRSEVVDGGGTLRLGDKYYKSRLLDPDRSLNRKRERFKVFEVELTSNRDDVIINLIIN